MTVVTPMWPRAVRRPAQEAQRRRIKHLRADWDTYRPDIDAEDLPAYYDLLKKKRAV